MLTIRLKRLSEHAVMPAYQTAGAAGMDISACLSEPLTIAPGERCLVPAGFAMAIPDGYAAFIYARSGLATKKGITLPNCVGVIDSDYRGEIKVALTNLSDEAVTIKPYDRVAQMVISRVEQAVLEEADDLEKTDRADGGFGSTGV